MSAYVVVATELHQTVGHGGKDNKRRDIKKYRRGDIVTDLTDDDTQRHLASGAIAEQSSTEAKAAKESPVVAPVVEPYVAPADQASPIVAAAQSAGGRPARPKNAAPKADWEEYAAAVGVDSEGKTREQLREETK
jgi:hypothetical protein